MWLILLFDILVVSANYALDTPLCQVGGEPICARDGLEYIYFENECKFNVYIYKQLFAEQPKPTKVALEECFSHCADIICPAIYQPVCAQQLFPPGPVRTVSNACLVNQLICETKQQWIVIANGPCSVAAESGQDTATASQDSYSPSTLASSNQPPTGYEHAQVQSAIANTVYYLASSADPVPSTASSAAPASALEQGLKSEMALLPESAASAYPAPTSDSFIHPSSAQRPAPSSAPYVDLAPAPASAPLVDSATAPTSYNALQPQAVSNSASHSGSTLIPVSVSSSYSIPAVASNKASYKENVSAVTPINSLFTYSGTTATFVLCPLLHVVPTQTSIAVSASNPPTATSDQYSSSALPQPLTYFPIANQELASFTSCSCTASSQPTSDLATATTSSRQNLELSSYPSPEYGLAPVVDSYSASVPAPASVSFPAVGSFSAPVSAPLSPPVLDYGSKPGTAPASGCGSIFKASFYYQPTYTFIEYKM